MSNIGIILDQYDALVKTTGNVNDSIIVLKKEYLQKEEKDQYSFLTITHEELKEARAKLLDFTSFLQSIHNESKDPDYNVVPKEVFGKFKKMIGSFGDILNALKSIEKKLKSKQILSEEHFTLLDRIVGALDKERGHLFKILRNSRA